MTNRNIVFPIDYQGGYQIHRPHLDGHGHCSVVDNHGQVVFGGTFDECEQWLERRGNRRMSTIH